MIDPEPQPIQRAGILGRLRAAGRWWWREQTTPLRPAETAMYYRAGAVLLAVMAVVLATTSLAGIGWFGSLVAVQFGLLGVSLLIRAWASDAFRRGSTVVGHRLLKAGIAFWWASFAVCVPLVVFVVVSAL